MRCTLLAIVAGLVEPEIFRYNRERHYSQPMLKAKTIPIFAAIAISSIVMAACTQAVDSKTGIQQNVKPNGQENSSAIPQEVDPGLQNKQTDRERELNAFFASGKYSYCDAKILANYWGQSVVEAKARIGRKIIWGKKDVLYLEQFMVDARVRALQNPEELCYFQENKYTYNDAVVLAEFWGDRTPWEAKLRIERNMILGNKQIVQQTLRLLNNRP
ncbi:MAG: hypothetical protein AB4352_19080 [Hormoscilla sp.]